MLLRQNCIWSQKVSFCDELNFGHNIVAHNIEGTLEYIHSDL